MSWWRRPSRHSNSSARCLTSTCCERSCRDGRPPAPRSPLRPDCPSRPSPKVSGGSARTALWWTRASAPPAADPRAVLAQLVDGPVTVDNDVNWAARAEHSHGRAAGTRDFVYLFLGEGLGCAVLTDGDVRRGHAGLAGEIAHVVTVGPRGVAMR